MLRRTILFAMSILFFSACGSGETQEGVPYVKNDSLGERTDVSISSSVRFLFNKEIDEGRVVDDNFLLYESNGTRVDVTLSAEKKYVTAVFSDVLSYDSNYTFVLQNVKDLTGTKMKSAYSGRFTTGSFVKNITPADGESDVSVFADIAVEFTETIDPTTLSITVDGLVFPTPSSSDNKTFLISPSEVTGYSGTGYDASYGGLTPSTNFNVTVSAASDIYGNTLLSPIVSSFTTVPPDTDPPVLVSSAPSTLATGVAVDSNITLIFDESIMAPSTTDFTLTDSSLAAKTFSVAPDLQNNTVEITPASALDYAEAYTLGINNISDVFGNVMTSSTITFTTSSILKSFYPVENGSNVPINSIITTVFKGAMDYSGAVLTLEDDTGTPVDGNSSFGTTYASFEPLNDLDFYSYYTAKISGVKDIYGNSLAQKSWSFTTRTDDKSPQLLLSFPANLETGVSPAATVSAQFDENIEGTIECILFDSQGESLAGELSISDATVTFAPSQSFEAQESYTVIITGVTDQYSNMAPPLRWEFTTE